MRKILKEFAYSDYRSVRLAITTRGNGSGYVDVIDYEGISTWNFTAKSRVWYMPWRRSMADALLAALAEYERHVSAWESAKLDAELAQELADAASEMIAGLA